MFAQYLSSFSCSLCLLLVKRRPPFILPRRRTFHISSPSTFIPESDCINLNPPSSLPSTLHRVSRAVSCSCTSVSASLCVLRAQFFFIYATNLCVNTPQTGRKEIDLGGKKYPASHTAGWCQGRHECKHISNVVDEKSEAECGKNSKQLGKG